MLGTPQGEVLILFLELVGEFFELIFNNLVVLAKESKPILAS